MVFREIFGKNNKLGKLEKIKKIRKYVVLKYQKVKK